MPYLEKYLHVKKSTIPNAGRGLFTKVTIKKGTRILEYKGKAVTWEDVKKMPDDKNGYVFYINKKHCIDAWSYKKALAKYANDAQGITRVKGIRNNAEYVIEGNKCYMEAAKDILKDGEILVSYGKEYWAAIRHNLQLEKQEKDKKPILPHAKLHKVEKRLKRQKTS